MNVIHMTGGQAAAVSGTSPINSHAALIPVAMTDGTYIVGVEVLADPAHASKRSALQAAPVVDVATLAAIMPVAPVSFVSAGSATVDVVKS